MEAHRKSRLIIGLMSGTSHDGVDAALVRIRGTRPGTRVKLLHHSALSYSATFRRSIRAAFDGDTGSICRLNFELGEVFAKAALRCAAGAGVKPSRLDAIASHGQTICHVPPVNNRRGYTLQIGEPAVIAQRTGVTVVSDFRAADVAAGGHGAPLVPYADHVLFRGRATRAVQNLGGIANVTVVTPSIEDVIAFDTGPGNSLIDEAMDTLFGRPFDNKGTVARRGRPDHTLIDRIMGLPYFSRRPPKSTGRELFGTSMLRQILSASNLRAEDLLCTLTHLTARSIRDAYERFVFPGHRIKEIIVSGGGTRNSFLMRLLREQFRPVPVLPIDDFGIPSAAKEAMSFAVLANETLSGNPSSLPRVTGASRPTVLGKITSP